MIEKYLKGWSFRTRHPDFNVGDEITVFVTSYEGEHAIARVGDTVIRIRDAPDGLVDTKVRVRISDFDVHDHTGEAELLERVGESAF